MLNEVEGELKGVELVGVATPDGDVRVVGGEPDGPEPAFRLGLDQDLVSPTRSQDPFKVFPGGDIVALDQFYPLRFEVPIEISGVKKAYTQFIAVPDDLNGLIHSKAHDGNAAEIEFGRSEPASSQINRAKRVVFFFRIHAS